MYTTTLPIATLALCHGVCRWCYIHYGSLRDELPLSLPNEECDTDRSSCRGVEVNLTYRLIYRTLMDRRWIVWSSGSNMYLSLPDPKTVYGRFDLSDGSIGATILDFLHDHAVLLRTR